MIISNGLKVKKNILPIFFVLIFSLLFNFNFQILPVQAGAVVGSMNYNNDVGGYFKGTGTHSGKYGGPTCGVPPYGGIAGDFSVDQACQQIFGANTKAGSTIKTGFHCSICSMISNECKEIECVEKTAPTCTLTASPPMIMQGESKDITVVWTTTDATSATLNGTPVTPLASGSLVFPNVSTATTYTLNITGDLPGGPCIAKVDIITPPIGGIVPCGRMVDNPATPYDEKEPCTLCHIFIMLQIISTFVVEMGGIITVFFLVIGGLIYATSAGDQGRMETGKKAVTWALFGLAIILLSWLIVTIVLVAFGYINPLGGQWNIVNCSVV